MCHDLVWGVYEVIDVSECYYCSVRSWWNGWSRFLVSWEWLVLVTIMDVVVVVEYTFDDYYVHSDYCYSDDSDDDGSDDGGHYSASVVA